MSRNSLLGSTIFGINLLLLPNMAVAKSAVEVGRIAKAITIEIKVIGSTQVGSGVLVQHEVDVYTVLTTGHVVETGSAFTFKTFDGKSHQSLPNSVRFADHNLDLAVVQFRSKNNYNLAKIGSSDSLEAGGLVYVAGFPEPTYAIEPGVFNFTEGKIIGNASQGNARGYSLIYSNNTFRGMSGGPVLNEEGELVAIHGQGDRTGANGTGDKTGRNLGIVMEKVGSVVSALGVRINQQLGRYRKASP
jgi:S1-C subfamily serine protease